MEKAIVVGLNFMRDVVVINANSNNAVVVIVKVG